MVYMKIAEIRQQKNLTQTDVSQYLKITQQTYSSYETGRRQMNFETLCMLADFYEVSTDYLLGRQDVMPSFLSEEERALILQYRTLDAHAKDAIKNNLAFEYSRIPKTINIKKSAV